MQHVVQALGHVGNILAAGGVVPDPAPTAPTGTDGAMSTLISYAKDIALICCAIGVVVGGGMIGIGHTSRRAELAERGKVSLLGGFIGAIIVALAVTLVNGSFSAVLS
jgi:hypothetical protein